MDAIEYRRLRLGECGRIKEIDASQFIKRAWRGEEGERRLIEINYHEPGFPEGFENHLARLRETIAAGGFALGAFHNGALIAFASVNNEIFGEKYKYVLLDQLFVSRGHRGKGIGKRLFFLSADEAKPLGAKKFYICAGSSEETIAFYFAVGCEAAKEINRALYEEDARDYQLEYDFAKLH